MAQGYYEVPRRVTLEELAREMNLSKATLAEHIQKAEKRLMEHLFGPL